MPGPAVFFGAEDEIDELHRRLDRIRQYMGLSWHDLADVHLKALAGEDAVLGRFDRNMRLSPTQLFDRLENTVRSLKPVVCILDTAADIFDGDEIKRVQVRQFVRLLRGLALRNNTSVVLLSHPSQSGIASGTGTSGSTGWNNSVRARMYLTHGKSRDDGEPVDPNERFLTFKKSNYGPKGDRIRLRWQNGLFVPDTTKETATSQLEAEARFLHLLDIYTKEGRSVGASPSVIYAPSVFAKDKRSNRIDKKALEAAMNGLFEKGEIAVETTGRPSKTRSRIVRKDPS